MKINDCGALADHGPHVRDQIQCPGNGPFTDMEMYDRMEEQVGDHAFEEAGDWFRYRNGLCAVCDTDHEEEQ